MTLKLNEKIENTVETICHFVAYTPVHWSLPMDKPLKLAAGDVTPAAFLSLITPIPQARNQHG